MDCKNIKSTSKYKYPKYNSWAIIFDTNNIEIGVTNTSKEADDICIKSQKHSYDYGYEMYPSKDEQIEAYKRLNLLTINDF